MDDRPTCLERAFALASDGSCGTLMGIRQRLKQEGYVEAGQLSGGHVRNQLIKLLAASRAAR
jgi:hypothetical protein